jgi:hypothetical protein
MKATSENERHTTNGRLGKKREAEKDLAATYNQFKEFEGKRYTGMKIGRRHKWYYDKGEWNEKKVTPDKWEFTFAVTKRRAGKAPEGSGVPVGTEYHWYILAHQIVRKLNANDYTTSMSGLKYKLAHKRADKDKWSASDRAQRRNLINLLKEMIQELEGQMEEPKKAAAAATPSEEGRATSKKPGEPSDGRLLLKHASTKRIRTRSRPGGARRESLVHAG